MLNHRHHFFKIFILVSLLFSLTAWTQRTPRYRYRYSYIDRTHTLKESAQHVGGIYVLSWGFYYATQPEIFRDKGSFKNYKENFGHLVFDKDEPFWNWMVHPYSGSQLYLYYRANGYSRIDAVKMSFISSALFEFFIETYTEPASIQDLYQTPIFGSALGLMIEKFSLYLLNTGNPFAKFWGYLINPSTLLWFYEGKVRITPQIDSKKSSLTIVMEF